MSDFYSVVWQVMKREFRRLGSRPIYTFCMIIAPLFVFVFFTTLMNKGLPVDLPAGIVDEDNTSVTRNVIRNLDAFQMTKIVNQYSNFSDARQAMQEGKIYAFFYIPKGTTELALANKRPTISFYTNASFVVAASLEYRDMKMMAEYASGAIIRETLYAKGYTEDQAMSVIQPIKTEMHPVNNPLINYSVYLCNILLPGALMILILQVTIYSIYSELKSGTEKEWLMLAKNDIHKALLGKLIPQFFVWIVMGAMYIVILYGILDFPHNNGILPMAILAFLLIVVSQSFGVFLCGCVPSMRWALSLATLWGVLSFSISGFSFQSIAFPAPLRTLCNLFPLRHYFLIYVDQALNGLPLYYSWFNIAMMFVFLLLPHLVIYRLKYFLLNYVYTK